MSGYTHSSSVVYFWEKKIHFGGLDGIYFLLFICSDCIKNILACLPACDHQNSNEFYLYFILDTLDFLLLLLSVFDSRTCEIRNIFYSKWVCAIYREFVISKSYAGADTTEIVILICCIFAGVRFEELWYYTKPVCSNTRNER